MKKEITKVITVELTFIEDYDDSHQEPILDSDITHEILINTLADHVELKKSQNFIRDLEDKEN